MAQNFFTTGAVTAVFPLATNIDLALTTTNTTYLGGFFGATDTVRLIAIIALSNNASNTEVLTLVDKAGVAYRSFTFTGSTARTPLIEFPGGGIAMPPGGFGVTTSSGAGTTPNYIFLFERTASTFVNNP